MTHWTPEAIKKARLDRKLNQSEFAKLIGVSRQQTVSEWEKGLYAPGHVICRLLDLVLKGK